MADNNLAPLRALVEDLSKSLPQVTSKKMFGCDGFFAAGTIYALIWKNGRIGVKILEPKMYEELMSMEGSEPSKVGSKVMSRWVLVPPAMHDNRRALRTWVQRAHAQALALAEK